MDKSVKVVQVGFPQMVTDQFDVDIVQVVGRETASEIGRQWRFAQDRVVNFIDTRGNHQSRQRVKHSKWMTSFQQLLAVQFVSHRIKRPQSSCNQNNHIVYHVPVTNVIHETGQLGRGNRLQILELLHILVSKPLAQQTCRSLFSIGIV